MRRYAKSHRTDLDQIEDNELAAAEAREPMPRNVQDFKNHPVYALERHLRRHEVLVPGAQMAGTVGAGSKGPLERIYRRRDVRIARSAETWYRMGREVKPGEEPVKILPKKVRRSRISLGDEDDEEEEEDPVLGIVPLSAGTPIYMPEQTELYRAPPVINGRVPKNKFGNLDVYVPSMVPEGGVHIIDEHAAHAAFVLGVDYAPALTGFQFKGRKGTAVLLGAIVPQESEEAVRAVIEGFGDLEAQMEEDRRATKALRMWSRFLKALRIRQRIWANVDPDAEEELEPGGFEPEKGKEVADEDMDLDDAPSDVTEEYFMEEDDEGGGGFLIE
ncbi:putative dna repair protein rhp41 protein [Phaeoacremonium minimum UCRPA7]|uniref:Putative dna repair protein rhp41 protein n=1 Tax=Phaeoacremonium minimum (strain UCR-PA7) TaxID=1286976 RepID=R8BKT9_PHAM7|nr:putative dna repair protein rhp41 protein [Phaeoacremonium minimum UCRPA7]EON99807.1 putative dna repair protein rhp41 protein [Phaeoacremonium minimum UCRPA7]